MAVRKKVSQSGTARGRFRKTAAPKPAKAFPELRKGKLETTLDEGSGKGPRPDPLAPSVEVPDSLIHELRLRSSQRQKAGTRPWTLQGIVVEALRDWLDKTKSK